MARQAVKGRQTGVVTARFVTTIALNVIIITADYISQSLQGLLVCIYILHYTPRRRNSGNVDTRPEYFLYHTKKRKKKKKWYNRT